MDKRPKKMATHKQQITLITPTVASRREDNSNATERNKGRELPATKVAMERGSKQSQMSSIRIGEFSMNTSKKGNPTTFAMAIRDNLFQVVKFLGGTNTSLEYSTLWIDEKAL